MSKYTKEELLNIIDELRYNILSNYNTESDFWQDGWSSMKDFVSLEIFKQDANKLERINNDKTN